MDYCVVVPVYNTTKVLFELEKQISDVFAALNKTYEIIFINDHSPYVQTWEILNEIAKKDNVRVINLTRNFGQQAATMCGLKHSTADYVITMDDDLQHNPFDIPKLIEKQNHSIVIGQLKNKKHSIFKRVTSRIKERFDRIILKKPKGIRLSAFRLINRNVVNGMLSIKTPTPFISALLFYVSNDVVGVNVEHKERAEGSSGYTLFGLLKLFSFLLINNSSLLLKIIGRIGIYMFLISLIVILFLIYKHLFLGYVLGWTSTMVTIIMFGGLQLFTLGIIGEYLIRIINYSEQKPPFVVKEILE